MDPAVHRITTPFAEAFHLEAVVRLLAIVATPRPIVVQGAKVGPVTALLRPVPHLPLLLPLAEP